MKYEHLEYIMINSFSDTLEDLKRQEKKKIMLENKGYDLIHSSSGCLTYRKIKEIKE